MSSNTRSAMNDWQRLRASWAETSNFYVKAVDAEVVRTEVWRFRHRLPQRESACQWSCARARKGKRRDGANADLAFEPQAPPWSEAIRPTMARPSPLPCPFVDRPRANRRLYVIELITRNATAVVDDRQLHGFRSRRLPLNRQLARAAGVPHRVVDQVVECKHHRRAIGVYRRKRWRNVDIDMKSLRPPEAG
jgi:hypothetical protein